MLRSSIFSVFVLSGVLAASCGKKSDSDAATETGSGGTTSSNPEISNVLATAVPSTLAISAFPQATATALNLADAEKEKPVSDKIAENTKILKGDESVRCFNADVMKDKEISESITCYDFDSDMNPHTSTDAGGTKSVGTKDGKHTTGEACMVAFARKQVKDAVNTVDRALAMVNGMICQGKKVGLDTDMPAVGAELDLKDAFKKGAGVLEVTTAKIARLEDKDGAAVYHSTVAMKDPVGRTVEVNLVHSPTSDSTGKGVMWYKRTGGEGLKDGQKLDPNNMDNKVGAMSINYEYDRGSDTAKQFTNFEVRRAQIVKTVEPFTEAGLVNYAGLSKTATNQEVNAINYVSFNVNPSTNEGKLSYWMNPGGNYEESARGFLFSIEKSDAGELKGCGVSGATSNVSIRKALLESSETNVLKPVRFWHPMFAQNTSVDKDDRYNASEGFKITEQCFKQDVADGLYKIDTDVTTDSHGYDVKEVAATKISPPKKPEQKLDGTFAKP